MMYEFTITCWNGAPEDKEIFMPVTVICGAGSEQEAIERAKQMINRTCYAIQRVKEIFMIAR